MKKLLVTLLALAAGSLLADPNVIFSEDFSGYAVGDFLPQMGDAKIYDTKHQTNFTYTITNDLTDEGKCLAVTKVAGPGANSGIWLPTGADDSCFTESGIMRFRFRLSCKTNLGGFIIGNGSNGRAIWAFRNGGTIFFQNGSKEIRIDSTGDQFYDYELNVAYPSRQLVNIIQNGVTNTPENFILANVKANHIGPASLCSGFVATSGEYMGAFKSVEVAYEPISTPMPSIPTDTQNIGRGAGSKEITISNFGSGEYEYSISALGDPEWLKFESEGVCKTTKKIKFTFDRNIMTSGFYRTVVTIEAKGFGSYDIPFNVRSGKTFYYETFEAPWFHEGELHGQQGWFGKEEGNDYSPDTNEAYIETPSDPYDGQCVRFERASGWDGYWYPVNTPSNLIIQVSCQFRWDPVGEADRFNFRSTYWRNPAIFDLWYCAEKNDIRIWGYNDTTGYPLVGDMGLPPGTWQTMSYTMDFRMQKLTSLTYGDFTTNFTEKPLRKRMNDRVDPLFFLEKFDVNGGNSESRVNVSIDNLLITEIERPKVAIPVYDPGVAMGGLGTFTNHLENAGAVNYKFTATLLDEKYAGNLKLSRTSGSIGTKGVVIYRLDRSGLEDGYHTARIKYDWTASNSTNSGSFVQLVTFGVGGWYYATDFEGELFHLGSIHNQECWKVNGGSIDPALVLEDGIQCLYFDQASKVTVQAGVPAGQHFSFRSLVKFPNNNNTTFVKFSQSTDAGLLPIYLRRDRDTRELICYYFPSGEEEAVEVFRQNNLDQWVDFTYDMDMDIASACLTKITLDGEERTFYEGEAVLNPEMDNMPVSSFIIEAVNDGPEEERDTGVFVKRVVACDATIPEPAFLGLALAAALLALRKRG